MAAFRSARGIAASTSRGLARHLSSASTSTFAHSSAFAVARVGVTKPWAIPNARAFSMSRCVRGEGACMSSYTFCCFSC